MTKDKPEAISRGGIQAAPLYLYESDTKRIPNLQLDIVNKFEKYLKLKFIAEKNDQTDTFTPLDIIDYVYAVLYSHSYREEFSDELRVNYPNIPYPQSSEYFWKMVSFGSELRKLHTEEIDADLSNYEYSGIGNNIVDKFTLKDNKIYINKTQYFMSKSSDVIIDNKLWNYTIGGFQPLQKWLKDRKKNLVILSTNDITHYMNIIDAIDRTQKIMTKIDACIIF